MVLFCLDENSLDNRDPDGGRRPGVAVGVGLLLLLGIVSAWLSCRLSVRVRFQYDTAVCSVRFIFMTGLPFPTRVLEGGAYNMYTGEA